ncbi:hypothetical protein B0H14DRAFT_2581722 [Mycena olivaceomarginata]|nr:hypothetical protein B0H14DRAFT_2581722 [Mycena olivaceomarginata]
MHGQPGVYREDQLWIYPKDPIFALQEAATTGVYSPDMLYLLPIFLWLPDDLPGHPDRFHCECGEALNKHSTNSAQNRLQHKSYRSTSLHNIWFRLLPAYQATLLSSARGKHSGCGRTYQGTDPWILAQLPQFVQDRFPVAISHRSVLDISQMDMMKITFAGRFGAEPFSKMLYTMDFGVARKIPLFSSFKNRIGFAGYAPSTKYLKSMFISWFASHRLHIDRIMSSLSGRILKADHTFKTVDHQGRLPGGEPIHTVLYNAVNDAEEVRFYALTLTHTLTQGMYERVQVELARHAHRPTEAIYTDNPRLERNWHESVTPSLKRNVQHIILNPFRDLPEFKVSGPSFFASSPDRIDTLCDIILQSIPTSDSIYIAISIGLEADKISSIQLRERSSIYVFAVTALAAHIPLALKSVLTHPRIIKFGHEITSSAKRLSSAWGLHSNIYSRRFGETGKIEGCCSGRQLLPLNSVRCGPESPTP